MINENHFSFLLNLCEINLRFNIICDTNIHSPATLIGTLSPGNFMKELYYNISHEIPRHTDYQYNGLLIYVTCGFVKRFFYLKRGQMAREYYKHIQQFSKSKYNLVNSSIQYSGSDFLHHQLNACRFPRQRNAKKRTPFALLWAHGCVWWRCQYMALADYKCNRFPQLEISSVHREYGHGKPADQSGLWLLSLSSHNPGAKVNGIGWKWKGGAF